MTKRIYQLTTHQSDHLASLWAFHQQLLCRGYKHSKIHPMILDDVQKTESTSTIAPAAARYKPQHIFLHVPYHPIYVASITMQQTFWDVLLHYPLSSKHSEMFYYSQTKRHPFGSWETMNTNKTTSMYTIWQFHITTHTTSRTYSLHPSFGNKLMHR